MKNPHPRTGRPNTASTPALPPWYAFNVFSSDGPSKIFKYINFYFFLKLIMKKGASLLSVAVIRKHQREETQGGKGLFRFTERDSRGVGW